MRLKNKDSQTISSVLYGMREIMCLDAVRIGLLGTNTNGSCDIPAIKIFAVITLLY